MEAVKIKICGIRRFEDVDYINELLPDYAGLVFAKSKRQIDLDFACELVKKLDRRIKRVGIFVNENIDTVRRIARGAGLDVLQFHGEEDEDYIQKFGGYMIWKAVGINILSEGNLEESIGCYQQKIDELCKSSVNGILADSKTPGMNGGTGVSFDWDIIKGIHYTKPIILAGGLNCFNVEEAIVKIRPFAVDVSSGIEVNGVKSYELIKEFISKVRKIE